MARRPRTGSLRQTLFLVVGGLLVLLLGTAGVTSWARATVAAAERDLSSRILPAREAAADLTTAYVDQETGQRGYLLTGDDDFLEPYESGARDVARLQAELAGELAGNPRARAALDGVRRAGEAWQTGAAEPEIALRRSGPIPPEQAVAVGRDGKALFDALRVELDALEERTGALTARQLDTIARTQAIANRVVLVTAVLAVVVGATSVLLVRRRLTRPMDTLVSQVRAVSAGEREDGIEVAGPRELVTIADSVERMRTSILQRSDDLVEAERELTLREEHDRLATDLHDLTIQRVFALGLRLSSLSRRRPDVAPALTPLIEETDRITREIRTVIFDLERPLAGEGLRARVLDTVGTGGRALGVTPAVSFSGPVDTVTSDPVATELVAVLREALSNVARHARADRTWVAVDADGGLLTLSVTDDGTGPDPDAPRGNGLRNAATRAARLGGTSTVGPGPDGGTTLRWQVPLGPRAD